MVAMDHRRTFEGNPNCAANNEPPGDGSTTHLRNPFPHRWMWEIEGSRKRLAAPIHRGQRRDPLVGGLQNGLILPNRYRTSL